MSSDHSSDYEEYNKTEWLKDSIKELASYIKICEDWLIKARLYIPDAGHISIIEALINDFNEFIQSCKILRVHIELLLRFDSHITCTEEWRIIKDRCRACDLDMYSLGWRCDDPELPRM